MELLKHCEEVKIADYSPPEDVDLLVSVDGPAGNGRVDVFRASGGVDPIGSVPTGSSGNFSVDAAAEVYLHYHAGVGKPQVVSVTYTLV